MLHTKSTTTTKRACIIRRFPGALLTNRPQGTAAIMFPAWKADVERGVNGAGRIMAMVFNGTIKDVLDIAKPKTPLPETYDQVVMSICPEAYEVPEKDMTTYKQWKAYTHLTTMISQTEHILFAHIYEAMAKDLQLTIDSAIVTNDLTQGEGRELFLYVQTHLESTLSSSRRIKLAEFYRVTLDGKDPESFFTALRVTQKKVNSTGQPAAAKNMINLINLFKEKINTAEDEDTGTPLNTAWGPTRTGGQGKSTGTARFSTPAKRQVFNTKRSGASKTKTEESTEIDTIMITVFEFLDQLIRRLEVWQHLTDATVCDVATTALQSNQEWSQFTEVLESRLPLGTELNMKMLVAEIMRAHVNRTNRSQGMGGFKSSNIGMAGTNGHAGSNGQGGSYNGNGSTGTALPAETPRSARNKLHPCRYCKKAFQVQEAQEHPWEEAKCNMNPAAERYDPKRLFYCNLCGGREKPKNGRRGNLIVGPRRNNTHNTAGHQEAELNAKKKKNSSNGTGAAVMSTAGHYNPYSMLAAPAGNTGLVATPTYQAAGGGKLAHYTVSAMMICGPPRRNQRSNTRRPPISCWFPFGPRFESQSAVPTKHQPSPRALLLTRLATKCTTLTVYNNTGGVPGVTTDTDAVAMSLTVNDHWAAAVTQWNRNLRYSRLICNFGNTTLATTSGFGNTAQLFMEMRLVKAKSEMEQLLDKMWDYTTDREVVLLLSKMMTQHRMHVEVSQFVVTHETEDLGSNSQSTIFLGMLKCMVRLASSNDTTVRRLTLHLVEEAVTAGNAQNRITALKGVEVIMSQLRNLVYKHTAIASMVCETHLGIGLTMAGFTPIGIFSDGSTEWNIQSIGLARDQVDMDRIIRTRVTVETALGLIRQMHQNRQRIQEASTALFRPASDNENCTDKAHPCIKGDGPTTVLDDIPVDFDEDLLDMDIESEDGEGNNTKTNTHGADFEALDNNKWGHGIGFKDGGYIPLGDCFCTAKSKFCDCEYEPRSNIEIKLDDEKFKRDKLEASSWSWYGVDAIDSDEEYSPVDTDDEHGAVTSANTQTKQEKDFRQGRCNTTHSTGPHNMSTTTKEMRFLMWLDKERKEG